MTVHLTLLDLLYAAGLVAAVVATSRAIGLQIESKVVIAACRATLQLGVLGYVLLVPLFERGSAALICAYLALVLLIAAREGASRPGYRRWRRSRSAAAFAPRVRSAPPLLLRGGHLLPLAAEQSSGRHARRSAVLARR